MDVDLNNVVLTSGEYKVSIAQHKVGRKVYDQELMVWGPAIDDVVIPFGSEPDSLVGALNTAIAMIKDVTSK